MLLFLVALVWIVLPVIFLVGGIFSIAKSFYLLPLVGSFALGTIFSIILSSVANMLLNTLPPLEGGQLDIFLLFVKTILGGFAQPTVTGVVLLSILCFLSLATAKFVAIVEDITVLVASHTVLLPHQDK